jgi:hypothetical protein
VGHTFYGLAPETFVLGADNQVYAQKFDANGYPAFGYFPTAPGQTFKQIRVARSRMNTPLVLGIGPDNQVYVQKFSATGDPKGGFKPVAPGQVKDLEVASDFFQTGEFFVLGMDNQVYAQKLTDTGDPVGTAYFLAAPGQVWKIQVGAAQSSGSAVPLVFGVGLDSQVYAVKFTANGDPASGYYLVAHGQVKPDKSIGFGWSQPAGGFVPELFVTGLDSQVYATKLTSAGDPAGGYFLAAAGAVKSFSVGVMSNNVVHPELFSIGMDNQVYGAKFSDAGNPAGGYFLTAPGAVSSLTASYVQKFSNYYSETFVLGLDSQVYVLLFDVNGNPSGGYVPGAPGQVH